MPKTDPRYARQVSLVQVGPNGQAALAQAKVAVIGLGGLGSVASLYLANSGVGQLLVNDFDRVDASNLPRQVLFTDGDVGRSKTEASGQRLHQFNPQLQVTAVDRRLTAAELAGAIRDCHAVLDCTDNFRARLAINAACIAEAKPLVSGAAIRFEGQLAVFSNGPGSPCYRCLYSDEDDNFENCAGQGILASVAGTVGTLMATETIKVLLGLPSDLRDRLFVYDGQTGATRIVGIPRRADCPACSTRP